MKLRHNYDLLIFDWDGTLINSIGWIVECIQTSANHCGLAAPTEQVIKNVIGLSLKKAMETLFPIEKTTVIENLIHNYNEIYWVSQMSQNDLFDGVYDMLISFKDAGCKLAVATGKSRSGLAKVLSETQTAFLFDKSCCADESASKPNPLMLRKIMGGLEIDPNRSLMIGDSSLDLMMARNAGIDSVAVSCGVHNTAKLTTFNPIVCLDQTKSLLDFL